MALRDDPFEPHGALAPLVAFLRRHAEGGSQALNPEQARAWVERLHDLSELMTVAASIERERNLLLDEMVRRDRAFDRGEVLEGVFSDEDRLKLYRALLSGQSDCACPLGGPMDLRLDSGQGRIVAPAAVHLPACALGRLLLMLGGDAERQRQINLAHPIALDHAAAHDMAAEARQPSVLRHYWFRFENAMTSKASLRTVCMELFSDSAISPPPPVDIPYAPYEEGWSQVSCANCRRYLQHTVRAPPAGAWRTLAEVEACLRAWNGARAH